MNKKNKKAIIALNQFTIIASYYHGIMLKKITTREQNASETRYHYLDKRNLHENQICYLYFVNIESFD